MKNKIDWIAVDWGTSSLRAWAMDAEGQDLDRTSSDQGMGKLTPIEFEPTLIALITPWLANNSQTDVISCGMVGAKQGWVEAPYQSAPCLPLTNLVKAPAVDPRLNVQIIGGVSQAKPADVMRGEETQIAGFQKLNPNWDGVICLPGTHTKWVQMSAGEIVSFQTFMTGEIFALLSTSSVLRHSVNSDEWDQTIFGEAVDEAMSRPEAIAARLFGLRAGNLLNDLSNTSAKSRLSGLLCLDGEHRLRRQRDQQRQSGDRRDREHHRAGEHPGSGERAARRVSRCPGGTGGPTASIASRLDGWGRQGGSRRTARPGTGSRGGGGGFGHTRLS